MPILHSRSRVRAPIDTVFAFFDDPNNLPRLMPPPVRIRLVRLEPAPPQPGSLLEFRYGLGPIQRSWMIRLVERVPDDRFVDETLSGPMRRFHHAHIFRAASGGGTWIEDRIDFHVGPDGLIGALVDLFAGLVMRGLFVYRQVRQRQLLG